MKAHLDIDHQSLSTDDIPLKFLYPLDANKKVKLLSNKEDADKGKLCGLQTTPPRNLQRHPRTKHGPKESRENPRKLLIYGGKSSQIPLSKDMSEKLAENLVTEIFRRASASAFSAFSEDYKFESIEPKDDRVEIVCNNVEKWKEIVSEFRMNGNGFRAWSENEGRTKIRILIGDQFNVVPKDIIRELILKENRKIGLKFSDEIDDREFIAEIDLKAWEKFQAAAETRISCGICDFPMEKVV